MPIRSAIRISAVTTATLGLAAALVGTAGSAGAAPAAPAAKPLLLVSYDVAGSTTIANTNSQAVVNFAPTHIDVSLQSDGTFRANLPLAPVRSSFKAYGFLPAAGTVVFTQVRPITGTLGGGADGPLITSAATYVVSLRDVVIGGTRANVGANCQTVRPVQVTVTSEPGFQLGSGGALRGAYTLSAFQNCGPAQTIINNTLPGPGNSLDLQFTNGLITNP